MRQFISLLCVCLEILVLLIVKFRAHCTILSQKCAASKIKNWKKIQLGKLIRVLFVITPDILAPDILVARLLSQSLFSDTNNRLQRNSSIIIMQVMRKCTNAILYGS